MDDFIERSGMHIEKNCYFVYREFSIQETSDGFLLFIAQRSDFVDKWRAFFVGFNCIGQHIVVVKGQVAVLVLDELFFELGVPVREEGDGGTGTLTLGESGALFAIPGHGVRLHCHTTVLYFFRPI